MHHHRELQADTPQAVPIVEADMLDTMNETYDLLRERAYEIYQSTHGAPRSADEDWSDVEEELVPNILVEQQVKDGCVLLHTPVSGFEATELEIVLAHQRAVVCGVHWYKDSVTGRHKRKVVLRIVELPFAVNPRTSRATFYDESLRAVLPGMQ